jgi:MauM/NapG family ferredoxin protein
MTTGPLRPPGALPEQRFLATCIRCGKCAQACPYGAITLAVLLDGLEIMGTPVIRPRKAPCYLCMKCPPVCPSGALKRTLAKKEEVRMGIAAVDKKTCLAWQGTLCRSCFDECPFFDIAIRLDDKLQPIVDRTKCVGCGICEGVCPADPAAIAVTPGERT